MNGSRLLFSIASFLFLEAAWAVEKTPLYQSSPSGRAAALLPLTLRDASRDDRWLGVPVRDVRWSPDGKGVHFRWNPSPSPSDVPEMDPWYRVDRSGASVERVPDDERHSIPSAVVSWARDGSRACWAREGSLYLYDTVGERVSRLLSLEATLEDPRLLPDGSAVDFLMRENLYRYDVARGALRQLTRKVVKPDETKLDAAEWREKEETALFERLRESRERESREKAHRRRVDGEGAQAIEAGEGVTLEDMKLSPDGRYVTFRARKIPAGRRQTQYADYVTRTGATEMKEARPKVGDREDEVRLGIVRFDPGGDEREARITWLDISSVTDEPAWVYGPQWSLEGDRAVVQILSTGHKDRWFAELDIEKGTAKALVHDHDDAWLGGPPPVAGYLQPALFEWLPGGRFVFASERTGWSHLYLVDRGAEPRALTAGEWEVRDAVLSRERSRWLITASREHPSDDHLYTMPAAGGELVRITVGEGRNTGFLSPDGARLAVVHSESLLLPDLYLRDPAPTSSEVRVTVSGTDEYYRHAWVRPEIVSFPHRDGKPVWAALFTSERPLSEKPAILHIHGGGYRQFSHRGYSVYGYGLHLGLLQYLVQRGYTVLDLDYRGSAGFGRDYRADIYRSMGDADVESAVAGVEYLVRERGIDRSRIGIYGISYGGFLTLMSQFRYPGVFAAGIANAAVTDWAHYQDLWTSRILSEPFLNPEAYRSSSPIYHADGLRDPLLIVHGLIDDNVQFQDAARLIQKLIELEKEFEVMVYPTERHTIETEASRFDHVRRAAAFFETHLLRRRGEVR